jgi:hypothetical protein
MKPEEFRALALSFDGATEGMHHGHPDFRAGGRIFASLAPDLSWGMIKLDPAQQSLYTTAEPEVYAPAAGAWGRGGATIVQLARARAPSARRALAVAHALATQSVAKRRRRRD